MKKISFQSIASIITVSLFSILCLSGEAQSLSGEEIRTQFLKDWERAKTYTLEYLQAVPADKYSFKPTDSVRSFAQQMLHLASSNIFLMGTATDNKIDWPGTDHEGKMINQSKDSVIYYVTKSYNFSIESIKAFDMSKLLEVVGPARIRATRFAYLLKSFEHQTHTLGQTTIYIRLLGLKPPAEKLF